MEFCQVNTGIRKIRFCCNAYDIVGWAEYPGSLVSVAVPEEDTTLSIPSY